MWTVIWTTLLVLGGLALALALVMVFVFTLGQSSVTYVLHLTLRDAAGQPLAHQPVLVWRHEYPRQALRTDAAGSLVVQGYESFGASGLVGPRRPDIFPIRLAFAGRSPLFYLFAVKRTGPVPYDVFNTERDNIFGGHWARPSPTPMVRSTPWPSPPAASPSAGAPPPPSAVFPNRLTPAAPTASTSSCNKTAPKPPAKPPAAPQVRVGCQALTRALQRREGDALARHPRPHGQGRRAT